MCTKQLRTFTAWLFISTIIIEVGISETTYTLTNKPAKNVENNFREKNENKLEQATYGKIQIKDGIVRRRKRYLIMKFRGKKVTWKKRHLTYRVYNYSKHLTKSAVDEELERAFLHWSNHTSLVFQHTTCNKTDIYITFATRIHHDYYPFDGKGKVAGHGFAPYGKFGGHLHFDDDETWITNVKKKGLLLSYTATHEIGHVLGLKHSTDNTAIMFSTPRPYQDPYLRPDDIAGIQFLYGTKDEIYNKGDTTDVPLSQKCLKVIHTSKRTNNQSTRVDSKTAITTESIKLLSRLTTTTIKSSSTQSLYKSLTTKHGLASCADLAAVYTHSIQVFVSYTVIYVIV